ncbi:NADPH-dependent FMN reductase [Wenzhouxiangella sp. XN79A]|uniref:NADPH-dependent FMN reductase n=1 Tax=Wenzhouxiangella sp. XN79A TaxID=2724193 RepID=UPI00197E362A|nr:NADPH-dependent FMN reductase [Wenzhouxiangella sp. XN79A]
MKWIAVSGSLRRDSFNTRLTRTLAARAPEGVTVACATLHGIPLYDGDLEERDGVPEAVEALRQRICDADGLILATPEYNGGMPGVFKNALDWLTRPPEVMGPTFANRPTALCGATPGGLGTTLAQAGSLVTLRQLKVALFPDHLRISQAGDALGEAGPEDRTARQIDRWLRGFAEFAERG